MIFILTAIASEANSPYAQGFGGQAISSVTLKDCLPAIAMRQLATSLSAPHNDNQFLYGLSHIRRGIC